MGNAPSALIETWTLYAVGSVVIMMRIITRLRTIGIRNFQPDDYLIFVSWATYTVMTVAAHIVGGLGDLHALDMETRKNLTPEEAAPLIYGTQWFCAGVATYILFIWTLKLNMLFLYQRVVRGLWVEKFIKPTIYLVCATFIATYAILFGVCRPYKRMWIVYPDQGTHCQPQSMLNMVPPLVFNIFTDVCIMLIPAPVVIPVRTTLLRRIGLLLLFTAGTFVMIAAILRVTMVLVEKNGPTAAIWSCREDIVAIIVGQAILIRPMFTKKFWTGKTSGTNNYYSSGPSANSNKMGGSIEMGSGRRGGKSKNKDPFSVTQALATVNEDDRHHRTGSTDKIMDSNQINDMSLRSMRGGSMSSGELEKGHGSDHHQGQPRSTMVIHVSKQVRVESDDQGADMHFRPHNGLDATTDATCWTGESGNYGGNGGPPQHDGYGRLSSDKSSPYTGRAL